MLFRRAPLGVATFNTGIFSTTCWWNPKADCAMQKVASSRESLELAVEREEWTGLIQAQHHYFPAFLLVFIV